jgi:hypothetical protein
MNFETFTWLFVADEDVEDFWGYCLDLEETDDRSEQDWKKLYSDWEDNL